MRFFRSLRHQLALHFILIAAAPLLGFGLFVLGLISTYLENESHEINLFLARSVQKQASEYLRPPIRTLKALARHQSYPILPTRETTALYLVEAVRHSEILESIFLLDRNRRVLYAGIAPRLAGQVDDYLGLDLSNHPVFLRPPGKDGLAWSDTFLSLLTGQPAISVGLPMGDDQYLIGNISLERLNHVLFSTKEQSEGVIIGIVDPHGVAIAHSSPRLVMERVNLSSHPGVRAGLQGEEATRSYRIDGREVLGTTMCIPDIGWVVYVDRDMALALSLLGRARSTLYGVMVAALLLCAAMAIVASRRLLQPLTEMTRQTAEIADGRYAPPRATSRRTYEEIELLRRGFRQMAGALQEREAALLEQEAHYRMLFDNSNDGVALAELTPEGLPGLYREANRVLCERLGYSREELLRMSPADILTEESHQGLIDLYASLERSGSALFEAVQVAATGERIPVEISARLVDFGGQPMLLSLSRDIRERKQAAEIIEKMTFFDSLTGLPNRHLVQDRLGQALANAHRDGNHLAVMFLNLDRFKDYNDSLGHNVADRILRETGQRLSRAVRGNDVLGRWGGDEFVAVLWAVARAEDTALVASKFLSTLAEPLVINQQPIYVTAAIGLSVFPQDGETIETLISHAETAMNHAKQQGRNSYRFFSGQMDLLASERMAIDQQLRTVLERGELALHYQPRIEPHTGRVSGVEALLRWQHPTLGNIPPGRFIPIAEESGLIRPIGQWVLEMACRQARAWDEAGLPPLRMAVNVSGRQLQGIDLHAQVYDALRASGLPPERLELEITERSLVEANAENLETFRRLQQLGVTLAIDDFGVEFSSLAQLKRFPVDVLKIDRSFITSLPGDEESRAIAEAIIALGMSLDLELVAEGVETEAQFRFLADRQCQAVQGFHFSPALPPDELAAYVRRLSAVEP